MSAPAVGYTDANGVWHAGYTDSETRFADHLEKISASVSTKLGTVQADVDEVNEPWTSYTPALTALAVGSGGSLVGRYRDVQDRRRVQITIKLGTGFSVTGTVKIALPSPAVALAHRFQPYVGDSLGGSMIDDSAVATRLAIAVSDDASTTLIRPAFLNNIAGIFDYVTATAPWTWAANDVIRLDFTYERA